MKQIKVKCVECSKEVTFTMTDEQYSDWKGNRKLIQSIFPELSEDLREMLISGLCPSCWDKLFDGAEIGDLEDALG